MNLVELYRRKLDNQKLSLQEFEAGEAVLRSRPSKMIIELTQNCNFRCVMCDQVQNKLFPQYAHYNSKLNMSQDLFDRIAEELFPTAYFVDLRGFGESLIHPQWGAIVEKLAAYPLIDWHLVTNLSLKNDAMWEKLVQNRFILGISFDGATQKTFEKIRVRSHFENILHNLKIVSDAVNRLGQGFLYFIVVVQEWNMHELSDIVKLAEKHGVRDVQFKVIHPGPHQMHLGPWTNEVGVHIARAVETGIEAGVRVTINDSVLLKDTEPERARKAAEISYPIPVLNFRAPEGADVGETHDLMAAVRDMSRVSVHKKCFKGYHYTYIASDGKVGNCNHMMNPSMHEMGDLNQSSFEEIWNGEPYKYFRVSLRRGMPFDHRCSWCFDHRLED